MDWIDAEFSELVPHLCRSGESQVLEFKRQFPEQARELAKDIAGFASSNDGFILLGVGDDGQVVGLVGAEHPSNRDEWSKRIAGVCREIEPPVRPAIKWASVGGRFVLGLSVSRGTEPIYFVDNKAYIRHATSCRPAKPSEIFEAVRAHQATKSSSQSQENQNEFLSSLAATLIKLLRWMDTDSEIRSLDPWRSEWIWDAAHSAKALRDLAVDDRAVGTATESELRALAEALDAVVDDPGFIGGGGEFEENCEKVRSLSLALMDRLIKPVPVSSEAQDTVKQAITRASRKLEDLWSRAAKAPFSNIVPDAQEESGKLGRQLAQFSYYGLDFLNAQQRDLLRAIGLRLFNLEAQRMYSDGGDSQRKAIEEGRACSRELLDLVVTFDAGDHA